MSYDRALKRRKAAVSCLIPFWSVTVDLIQAAGSCEYHELNSTVLLWPMLENDLEEMTKVLKLQLMPSVAPPSLRSHPTPPVALFSSSFLPPFLPSVFPTFASAPPQFPPLSFFLRLLLSSLLSPLASFSPFIPLPLCVTSGSSLPGDLQ